MALDGAMDTTCSMVFTGSGSDGGGGEIENNRIDIVDVCVTMGIKFIHTEDEFLAAINLPKSIIYLLVDWSGPERISRKLVFDVLDNIDLRSIQVYQIDCSKGDVNFVEDWLINQVKITPEFLYGGWGETLLFADGVLVDVMQHPFKLGYELVKLKIDGWLGEGVKNPVD